MEFSVNHPIIWVMVAIIIVVVLAQSIFFLIRAIRRAKELNISDEKIKKTITGAIVFTIAPAIAILVGVFALSKSLGIAIPWYRLSVIGSLTYETTAAANTLEAIDMSTGTTITDPAIFVSVVIVMTLGIITGLILVPTFGKKIYGGVIKMETKDKRWGEILNDAMFLGMISAFLGYVFCGFSQLWLGPTEKTLASNPNFKNTSVLVPVFVMLISASIMVILGVISKKTKWRWINDYALPICLIVGMGVAIPLTAWLA